MAFLKKSRTPEEQAKYDEKQSKRNAIFIYHYCLNENLPKEHPDFCFNCWVDECESQACAQQNWKYCEHCESKGFPKFTLEDREKGLEIAIKMKVDLEKHRQENMTPEQREKGRKLADARKNKLKEI